jgi:hypothetical protein
MIDIAPHTILREIPTEVWQIILNHLGFYSIRFATVSKIFYQIIYRLDFMRDATKLFDLASSNTVRLKLSDINDDFIQRFTNLQILNLDHEFRELLFRFRITDMALSKLSDIRSLNLRGNKLITDKGLENLLNITDLDLSENDKISDSSLKRLTKITKLALLNNERITDYGINELFNINSLQLSGGPNNEFRSFKFN